MRIEKIMVEINKAKERIAEWQARLRDLERQKTEQENMEILQVVRGVAASPDEIRSILAQLRAAKEPSPPSNTNHTMNNIKEETNIEKE